MVTCNGTPRYLKAAWVLTRSPKSVSEWASHVLLYPQIPHLAPQQRLPPQAVVVNRLMSQNRNHQGNVAVTYRVRLLMNGIVLYEKLSLKARNQRMEKPRSI